MLIYKLKVYHILYISTQVLTYFTTTPTSLIGHVWPLIISSSLPIVRTLMINSPLLSSEMTRMPPYTVCVEVVILTTVTTSHYTGHAATTTPAVQTVWLSGGPASVWLMLLVIPHCTMPVSTTTWTVWDYSCITAVPQVSLGVCVASCV